MSVSCMVRTQSKNKDDIEASKDLLKEVNECLHDMYDEASSGHMVIPDLSNTASPLSNQSPPQCHHLDVASLLRLFPIWLACNV